MNRIIYLFAATILFSSCKQYHYTSSSSRELVPIATDQVVIYTDRAKVPKNAEEIGIITANSNSQHKVLRKAKQYAAAHGANGIYFLTSEDISRGQKNMNALIGTNFKGKYSLVAVYVKP